MAGLSPSIHAAVPLSDIVINRSVRDTGGNGLGLAIADQIARSHRGRIEVTGAVGQGSTFLVFLPFAAATDCPIEIQSLQTINVA